MLRFAAALLGAVLLTTPYLSGADIPRPAPEFAVKMPNGQQLLLSQYRGKVVALEFMFTTCVHCQASAQVMTRIYKELGPRGFQPVGVAFNDMAAQLVPDFVRQYGVTFPVGVASRESVMDFLQHSEMIRMVVPQIVLIDRRGVIRQQLSGEQNEQTLKGEIEKLLDEPAAQKGSAKRAPRARKAQPSAALSKR